MTFRKNAGRIALLVALLCASNADARPVRSASGGSTPPKVTPAPVAREIDSPRIRLSDVMPDAPSALLSIDLGPSPSPGTTRLVGKDEIEIAILKRGPIPKGLKIPQGVRIGRAANQIMPDQLTGLLRPLVEKQLRTGVTLFKLEPSQPVVVSRAATIKSVSVPEAPRHKGPFRTTATVEFAEEDASVVRIFVPTVLDVSESAARPDVARGAAISLLLEKGGLQIQTAGSVVTDANIGDVVNVQVAATGRVIKARIQSTERALIVERP